MMSRLALPVVRPYFVGGDARCSDRDRNRRLIADGSVIVAAFSSILAVVRGDDPDDQAEQVRPVRRLMLTEEIFDQLLLNNTRVVVVENGVRKVVSSPRGPDTESRLLSVADTEIRTVDSRCNLTDWQKQK